MDRHNLCAVSQCEWATAHVSGNSMITVDYTIASRCHLYNIIMSTLLMTDLNTSDHLPVAAELTIEYPVQAQPNTRHPRLDWEEAIKSGEINEYRQLVEQQLSGLNSHAWFEGMEGCYPFSTLRPKQSGPTNLERERMPKRRTTL